MNEIPKPLTRSDEVRADVIRHLVHTQAATLREAEKAFDSIFHWRVSLRDFDADYLNIKDAAVLALHELRDGGSGG